MRTLALALALAACSPGPSAPRRDAVPAPRPDAALAPEVSPDAAPAADRLACERDEECVTTCSLGAVSAAWLRAGTLPADCDDGCASKGLGARCHHRACETVDQRGAPAPGCSRRGVAPGPWDCAVDGDCVVSCGRGAVNRAWFAAVGGPTSDCLDGCAADGFAARCRAATCVTVDEKGAVYAGCTRKGAPSPGRFDCVVDSDCVTTCAKGALNRAWLVANQAQDLCVDGCASQAFSARCQDGGCVTVGLNGEVERSCTRKRF